MSRQSKMIEEGTTLQSSVALRRLHVRLQDLIIGTYERLTKTPSKLPYLEGLRHVCDESADGKFSMHFVALVRDLKVAGTTTIGLTITASETGDLEP